MLFSSTNRFFLTLVCFYSQYSWFNSWLAWSFSKFISFSCALQILLVVTLVGARGFLVYICLCMLSSTKLYCFDLLFYYNREVFLCYYLFVWWLCDFIIYGFVLLCPSEYSLYTIQVLIIYVCIVFRQFKMGGLFHMIYFVCNLALSTASSH